MAKATKQGNREADLKQQRIARIRNHPANKKALAGMKRKYVRKANPTPDAIAKLEKDTHDQIDGMMRRIDALQLFVNKQADAIVKLQFPAVAAFTDFDVNKLDPFVPERRDLFDNPPRAWELLDLTNKPKAPDWRSIVMESSRKENERLRLEGVRKDEKIEQQRKTITKLCTMVPHDVLKKAMEG